MERLQKVIAQAGITSRRKAEELITAGKVSVNGVIVTELGVKVTKKDVVIVNGKVLEKEDLVYYLLYKPKSCVSTLEDEHQRFCITDLIGGIKERVYPVGRLDYDTTGALILTNDGDFANMIAHPSSHVYKIYDLTVEGNVMGEHVQQLEYGVMLDGVKTLPAKVKIIKRDRVHNHTMLTLTIFEGKNHQVKRMMEAVGNPVKRLHRSKIGTVNIEGMKPGEIRRLKPQEIKELKAIALQSK